MTASPDRGAIERSEELRAITARWFDSVSRADAETALARFTLMDGLSVWGTLGEYIEDRELLVRYTKLDYDQDGADAWDFGPLRIDAWVEGSVGWSLTHSTVEFEPGPRKFRCTLVFHLERDEWKIVHEHWSFEAPEETYGSWVGQGLELLSKAARAEQPDLTAWTSDEGTTTLVFTDIEGSTALTAAFGDRAWIEVLEAHNEVIENATTEHGGTVVKSQGDGFMLAFPSARKALTCAFAIERRIDARFSDPGSPIRVRIGMHTGEAVSNADDFFGHAVNYAARVAGAARGGEILASKLVHDLTSPTGMFSFGPPRMVELKGLADSAPVYPLVDAR